ncbi:MULTISPECIES: MFS transporter [Acidiplasma]|nr:MULTISPECIES: MFS transporter [Acidiplasma]WMT55894.1 MAG: MFS transporter [Acidiplasma sp.]
MILAAISFFLVFWDVYNIGFVLPVASAQLGVPVSNFLYALPVTTGLVGYIFGELGLGYYAQLIGRKTSLLITLVIAAVGSILSAISQNFVELSIFRFIVGISIGAEIGLISTYMSEITPFSMRGSIVGISTAVGMIEILPVGAMAYFVIPTISWGWRLMLGLGAIVAIPAIIMRYTYMPESPRWLLKVGKKEQAEHEIQKMEAYIKKKFGKVDRVSTDKVPEEIEEQNLGIKALFKDKKIRNRIFIILAVWFFYYIGDYGLVSVVPTLFVQHGIVISTTILYFFLTSIGDPIGSLTGMALSDRIERKTLSFITMGLSFIFFIMWGIVKFPALIIIAGALVFFTQGLWLPVMYAYTAELFPTEGRSAAMGFTDGIGHIGGAIAPYLILPIALSVGIFSITGYSWSFIFMGLTALIAGIIVIALGPKTKNRRLEDISETIVFKDEESN